jgi:hypothetical protein
MKESLIADKPLLVDYFRDFSQRLREPGARLMITGYGFRDQHINKPSRMHGRIILLWVRSTSIRMGEGSSVGMAAVSQLSHSTYRPGVM